MKLENAVSTGYLHQKYAVLQDRALFIGVHTDTGIYQNHDTVVLLFKDKGSWELAANQSEDAFHFLYRYIERHSKRMYGQHGDPYYKEIVIAAFNGSLTLPNRPEYGLRDIEKEIEARNRGDEWKQFSSFQKIKDWIHHLPVSGTSKRIFLETHAGSNYPAPKGSFRNKEMEIMFAIQAFKRISEWKGLSINVKGWKETQFDGENFRDAFVAMLVSMAYGRWKSKDKSGVHDFLKIVADHDGTFWLLDDECLKVEESL